MMTEADYSEIRQLVAKYSETLDFGDIDGFVSCFAEDGVVDTSSPEAGLSGVHKGHAALRKFASATLEYTGGLVRQTAFNVLIDGDGQSARASSFAFLTRAYHDQTRANYGRGVSQVTRSALDTTGMYYDELVKVNRRWLFSRRQFRHDGLPDVIERVMMPTTIGPRN